MKGKTKNRIWRRIVSLAMVFILLMQLVSSPMSVFAETTSTENTPTVDKSTLEEKPVDFSTAESTDTTSEVKDYEEVVKLEEVTEETVDLQSLAVDKEGIVYYNGKPLYAGKGDEKIPAKLDNLMKEGVSQILVPEDESTPLETALNSVVNFIFPTMKVAKASDAAPVIKYNGQVTYGATTVGSFTIDGVLAYCLQHTRASPASNTPYGAVQPPPHNNEKIQKALYYGWGGAGNIFKDRTQGIVVTSSVLSRLYSGHINGENLPGYSALWDKVQNGQVPSNAVSLSDSNLAVKVSNGKQVSESTTFKAFSSNTITFNIPSNVRFVNESTGKGKTGGTITVKGGDRFHFEAPLNYNTTYNSGKLSGSIPKYQPLITIPKSSDYQVLGMLRVYIDPTATVSFTVPFKTQQVTQTIKHVDSYTGKTVRTTNTKRTIGTSYKVCPATDLKESGYNLVTTSECVSGTTPSNNFTTTFYYTSYHYLTINYYDNYSGDFIKQAGRWTYQVGATYSKNANLQFNHGTRNTLYKNVGSNAVTGKMGRGDKVVNVKYNPYHNITVKWQNKYPEFDVFKTVQQSLIVGTQFNYTQPEYFLKSGLYYDREDNHSFSGILSYEDKAHTFFYKLRRNITVNYFDERTAKPISPTKTYIKHEGDSYSEKAPLDFKKDDYTYRYVKTDGDPQSGVVGKKNIEINYYYDIPLVELGLKKIQIYTAKSTEGLPVKVELTTKFNYSKTIDDMNDPNKTVTIALYQGSNKLDSKKYKAKDIPTKIDFKIGPSGLKPNIKLPYTVKIEGYDKNDFDVISDAEAITTAGYTSSEKTFNVDVDQTNLTELDYLGVVMTEREVRKEMKLYYETFTIPLKKLKRMRTGYGFEMPLDISYNSEIASNKTDFAFNMVVPMDIVDKSYIEYPIENNKAVVALEKTKGVTTTVDDKTSSEQNFQLKNVYVEKVTGHLFSEEQKQNSDERIKNPLIEGGRKFYLPIWSRVGDYKIGVTSKNSIGINLVNVKITHNLNVFAHMVAHMDSETLKDDAILFIPVDKEEPFPEGIPSGWTQADIDWIESK